MKRKVYIIPGYKESYPQQKGYGKAEKLFRENGFEVVQVRIDWKYQRSIRFADLVDQFFSQYKKSKNEEVYLLGFSFGAILALLAAPRAKPNGLILCSLSPYFKEDHSKLNPRWLRWWRRNVEESDYSMSDLTSRVSAKTYILAGDKEGSDVTRRVRSARRKIPKSRLFIARGAKHNIGQKQYQDTLKRVIQKL